jgi:hypothetical protein
MLGSLRHEGTCFVTSLATFDFDILFTLLLWQIHLHLSIAGLIELLDNCLDLI